MFFVIDSIDGGGSETQGQLVSKKLKQLKKIVDFRNYPNYNNPVGQMIKKFLYETEKLSVEKQFLLYSMQFILDAEVIQAEEKNGIVIADRYFTTTLVFQTLQGIKEKTALQFARDFGIIEPDIVFFLDVRPETAFRWKHGEDKELNFWEKDLPFIRKTYEKYTDFAQRNIWSKWVRINGERSKEEVRDEIVDRILNFPNRI